MNWLILLIAASAYSQAVLDDDNLLLRIDQGELEGHWKSSLKGRRFAAFEGIPFAKPPIGDLRFSEPQFPEPWHGTLQAKNVSRYCIQWYHLPGDDYHSITGDEDCLYLNVYTPKFSKAAKLPVIVYVHGGAFIFGTGVSYEPDFLMDKDVVYVNVNYRLGPLGFMSTQDSVVPGNNGMKDQVMALRWVRKNIKYFGGNPNSVTIMGMSAGGASVHYHMISPLSKDLFQRGISQSGTVCCPWTLQTRPREKALFIGNHLGCPTESTIDMIKCLKQRPAASIVATVNLFMPFLHSPFSPFAPVIEPVDTVNGFITVHPYESVKNGAALDIPWLNSLTTHEGIYPAGIFASDLKFIEELNSKWVELFPFVYDFNDTLPVAKHRSTAEKIKEHYFGSKSISMESIGNLIDSISDRHFVVDVEKCVRLQANVNKKPIYLYRFAYSGSDSLGKFLSQSDKNYGVSHGDDTGYCLKTEYMDSTTNNQDKAMIEFMTNMIYTFAKYGKPDVGSVEWLPIDGQSNKINYLEVKSPSEQLMRNSIHIGATEFWESLKIIENENFAPSCRDEF